MGDLDDLLGDKTEFEWDDGNKSKNWERHRVTQAEAEEVFVNRPVLLLQDEKHSVAETRYALLGRSSRGRPLTIIFTLRGTLVRVVSARPMSRRERAYYGTVEAEEA